MGSSSAVCSFCTETDKEEQRMDKNDFMIKGQEGMTSLENNYNNLRNSEFSENHQNFSLKNGKSHRFIIGNFGIIKWENNSIYKGYFKNEIPNGWGIFSHPTNGVFQGEYVNDMQNGYGLYKHITESLYEGYWENEKQNGIGVERWQDGAVYCGEFIQGKKDGIGKYIFPNKNVYYGMWEQNLMNGYGLYKYGRSEFYCGEWLNGLKDGYGEVFGANNNFFFGFFRNNIQNGFFLFYNNLSGKIIVGFHSNGKIDGVAKVYKPKCEGKFLIVNNGHKLKEIENEDELDKLQNDKKYMNNLIEYQKHKNKFFFMKRNEIEQYLIDKINQYKNEKYEIFLNNDIII